MGDAVIVGIVFLASVIICAVCVEAAAIVSAEYKLRRDRGRTENNGGLNE